MQFGEQRLVAVATGFQGVKLGQRNKNIPNSHGNPFVVKISKRLAETCCCSVLVQFHQQSCYNGIVLE